MIIRPTPGSATHEFACHSSACRPPTSGGSGGSIKGTYRGKMTSDEMAKAASKNTITYSKGQRKTLEDARKGKGVIRDAHGFPFKDQAAAKSVTDHQAAERARLDRAMGIKPQAQSITTLNKAEKARLKGVAPARDVSPHATQGRAGSSPEQYRRNQEILIRARKRVREKLAMNRKVQRGKTVSPYEDD